jgi:predicted PurR-regulated permease PerM
VTITPRTLWLALGIVAAAIGLWILLVQGIYVFILLFIAIILAEGIRPIMNFLHQRWRLPRPLAVGLIFLGVLAVFGILGWILIQPVLAQASAFIAGLPQFGLRMSQLLQQIQHWLGNNPQVSNALNSLQGQAGALAQRVLPLLVEVPLLVGRLLLSAVVVAAMTFFWLTGIEHLRPFVISLFPQRQQALVDDVIGELSFRIGGYLRGVVFNMFVIGILSGLGVWVLGVPYPALLGIIAGLTELLPYIGPWISGGVALLVAGALVGPLKAVEVIGYYILLQQIEGNTLVPIVMMNAVNLNPLTVIVAVLLGSEMLGLAGGVLAVPAAAVLQVLIVRVLAPVARHAAQRAASPPDAPTTPPTPASQPP